MYSHDYKHQRYNVEKTRTIEEMASVQEAAKKMKDKNVSSLVVDANGKLEGIVTVI